MRQAWYDRLDRDIAVTQIISKACTDKRRHHRWLTFLISAFVFVAIRTADAGSSHQGYVHENWPYSQQIGGDCAGPEYGGTKKNIPCGPNFQSPRAKPPEPRPYCSAEDRIQAFIDLNRQFWDDMTFGATKWLREQLLKSNGEIVDVQAAEIGSGAALASAFIPLPVPSGGKARVAISFWEFAKGTEVSAEVARAVKAAADTVWKMGPLIRGEIIERAVGILEYIPKGFDWIGVQKKGWFPYIDFINYGTREQVSLKTIYALTERGWSSAVKRMKDHIEVLGNVEKQWLTYTGHATADECARSAVNNWKRVLDIRVPKGFESKLDELISYGRRYGIEVRISTF